MSNGFVPDKPSTPASGFVPDTSKPPADPGNGFVPDKPPSPAPTPGSPHPTGTPHDYDTIISTAAKTHGLDPSILRAVGMQESGLGKGLTPQGLSPTPGNAGHGIWQLDPASGASANDLVRAAAHPEFAADYASKMLKRNLEATHGDLRGALAMYNAGSATSTQGLKYADEVLTRMRDLDPLHIDPAVSTRITFHVGHVVQALKNKQDPWRALSRTPELAGVTHVENQVKGQWDWLKHNALEGVGDILTAPMRAVQDIATELNAPDMHTITGIHNALSNNTRVASLLRNFNQAIWEPSAPVTKRIQEGFRQEANREMSAATRGRVQEFLPSNREVDNAIKAHIWAPIAPQTSFVAQTANDFAQQVIADPFQAVLEGAGAVLKATGKLAESTQLGVHAQHGFQAAGGVIRAAHNLMPPPVQAAYGHLATWAKQAENTGNRIFGVRRDLDEVGFTRQGKQARMSIENKHEATYNDLVGKAKKVAHDPDAATDMYWEHAPSGEMPPKTTVKLLTNPGTRAIKEKKTLTPLAETITRLNNPATTAVEREKILTDLFKETRNEAVNADTARLLKDNPKYFVGHAEDIENINVDRILHPQSDPRIAPVMNFMAKIGKKAILYNSLPHGLINEGTLTYMAGGIPALVHGISAMVVPVQAERIQELMDMGALPPHIQQKFSGIMEPLEHMSQNTLEHMEVGWRVGLAKTLEKTLGKPETEVDKLIRGWLINDKVGDYRNQSAFVRFFQALGGPFVAFHLGIVPKAFIQTLLENPDRIKRYQMLGQDIQNHRQTTGQDFISDSSPVAEGANMMAGLGSLVKAEVPQYAIDALDFSDFEDKGKNAEGVVQHLGGIADHYLSPVSLLHEAGGIATGQNRPGQQDTTLQEKLLDAILLALGKHYRKRETDNQVKTTNKEMAKGTF